MEKIGRAGRGAGGFQNVERIPDHRMFWHNRPAEPCGGFRIDPDSPYQKPAFAEDKKFVFFCAGGWRSALAAQTAQRMGLKPVAHIKGGFGEWKKSGAPVEQPAEKPKS